MYSLLVAFIIFFSKRRNSFKIALIKVTTITTRKKCVAEQSEAFLD